MLGAAHMEPQPTDEDVYNAAKAANIHEFVMSLPDQYDTTLEAKGTGMSPFLILTEIHRAFWWTKGLFS